MPVLADWDKSATVAQETIMAEVEEYDFSRTWSGSTHNYEQLKPRLAIRGIVPYDIKQSPDDFAAGIIRVQFAKDLPDHEKAQWPAGLGDVKLDGCSGIPPLGCRPAPPSSANELFDHPASNNGISDNLEALHPDEHSARHHVEEHIIGKHPAEHMAAAFEKAGVQCGKTAATLQSIIWPKPVFWHRRGQVSVRLASVVVVSQVEKNCFVVFTEHRHMAMKFKSHKSAVSARHDLMEQLCL